MLSSVLDLEFGKYYNDFVPTLKDLLEAIPNTDEKNTTIRMSAIECLGFIITSIRNQEGFIAEVDRIIEYFVVLQKKLAKDDTEQACIMDVYAQISSYLQEQFSKYLPHVYESVLESVDIEIKLVTSNTADLQEVSQKKFNIAVSTTNFFI